MVKIKVEKSWVSKVLLYRMITVWIALVIIGVIFHPYKLVTLIFGIASVVLLGMILLFYYAYYKFSTSGGDIQGRVSDLVTQKIAIDSSGRLLDIGCGSGVLSVELALKCPQLTIQAIDYWGSMWGYSKEKCEDLAEKYGTSDRICFEKGSASTLPFADETFDIVISNMVFHEVADAKDKREVIKEALRVLKKGGQFVFQDLFLSEKLYGKTDDLLRYIERTGISSVSLEKTKDQIEIPSMLNSPLFFGNAALLFGVK